MRPARFDLGVRSAKSVGCGDGDGDGDEEGGRRLGAVEKDPAGKEAEARPGQASHLLPVPLAPSGAGRVSSPWRARPEFWGLSLAVGERGGLLVACGGWDVGVPGCRGGLRGGRVHGREATRGCGVARLALASGLVKWSQRCAFYRSDDLRRARSPVMVHELPLPRKVAARSRMIGAGAGSDKAVAI